MRCSCNHRSGSVTSSASARPVNDLVLKDSADLARHSAAVRQAQLTSTDYDSRRFRLNGRWCWRRTGQPAVRQSTSDRAASWTLWCHWHKRLYIVRWTTVNALMAGTQSGHCSQQAYRTPGLFYCQRHDAETTLP